MEVVKYNYNDLSIESFIDSNQNIYFKGKEIAKTLGYEDTRKRLNDMYQIRIRSYLARFQREGETPLP